MLPPHEGFEPACRSIRKAGLRLIVREDALFGDRKPRQAQLRSGSLRFLAHPRFEQRRSPAALGLEAVERRIRELEEVVGGLRMDRENRSADAGAAAQRSLLDANGKAEAADDRVANRQQVVR